MQRVWRVSAPVWLAMFAVLAGFALHSASVIYPAHWAMDLYHPWGIPIARDVLGGGTNPYADTQRYGAAMEAAAKAAPTYPVHWVQHFWSWRSPTRIEPTGTPFYYAAQAHGPRDFDDFHLLYTVVNYLAAACAIYLLARMRGVPWPPALCLAPVVVSLFYPVIENARVANISSAQLLGLAALLGVAHTRLWERSAIADRGYLAALALFLLFKPNTLFIVAALALHYAVARGWRCLATGAAIAAGAVLVAAAWGAGYFGSARVWLDWLAYTQGGNGGTLLYALIKGNIAMPVQLAERAASFGTRTYSTLLAAAFALMLLACASRLGRDTQRIGRSLRAWLADPWCAACIGALAMFVFSPLLWPHYLVFALIPIAWFAIPARGWTAALGIASFLLFSLLVLGPFIRAGQGKLAYEIMSFAWLPLLPALLAQLACIANAPVMPAGVPRAP